MGELWLVRHGETAWSRSGKHTGRTDIPLTPEGTARARELGGRLRAHSFAIVLTSPLGRAKETCALSGYAGAAVVDPDLVEWDYGAYEGRRTEEIRRDAPGWTIFTGAVPNGEEASAVAGRAERVIARASAAPGDALVFGHGHALRMLALVWARLPIVAGDALALDPGSISILSDDGRGGRVIRLWNGPGPIAP